MTTVKPISSNSGAGYAHPDDPALRIATVTPVSTTGLPSSGNEGARAYGYDLSGNVATITWTVNGGVYVKTLTWANNNLQGISDWVKQ